MHGCNPGSALLVNAEVDSMGGVVDSGVGISQKTSPRRAAIEKAQAELRHEYDIREERRRELEFLEKGGNPLDFKFGYAASVSVQSTSLTDQHHEEFVTSEAKGSFALTASPHGDSVESSGRPGAPSVCEPNSADNLLLFDGENESLEGEKNFVHLNRKNAITPSEQSSQIEGSQNAKESEDSAIFRPYARRNRTRSNRDGSRSGSKDGKGLLAETNKQRDQNIPPISKPKPVCSNGNILSKDQASTKPTVMELDGGRHNDGSGSSVPDGKLHAIVSKSLKEEEQSLPSQDCIVPSETVLACDANAVEDREHLPPSSLEHHPSATTEKSEIEAGLGQPNGLCSLTNDSKCKLDSGQICSGAVGSKGLDSESSCTRTSLGLDVSNDSDKCIDKENVSNGDAVERKAEVEKEMTLVSTEMLKERNENNTACSAANDNNDQSSLCQNDLVPGGMVKSEDNLLVSSSVVQKELKDLSVNGVQQNEYSLTKSDTKEDGNLSELPGSDMEQASGEQQGLVESLNPEIPQTTATDIDATAAPDTLACPADCLKLVDKAHEDSILEEARIIQAKRKRIAELSAHTLPPQSRRRSQWDFVLEEMVWLANDFSQERLWKMSAARQFCRQAAFASQQRLEVQGKFWKMKSIAHDIAKTVLQFWHRAELLLDSDCTGLGSGIVNSEGVPEIRNVLIKNEDLDEQRSDKSVLGYAVRFVKYNRSLVSSFEAEVPATPDRISGLCTVDVSWGEQLTAEALFYTVPAAAMEVYRKSIESLFTDEKIGTSVQEEVETSTHFAMTEFGSEEFYEDDEGEPSTHYMHGAFEHKSTKSAQKKLKATMKSYTPKIFETGTDLPYGHCMVAPRQSVLIGKRSGSLHVGTIPTKRMRTASRQRMPTPFGPGVTGVVHSQNKTDASSGDTNSFQDDLSTLHGGSQMQKSVEVESVGEFEKQLAYDCAETSIKSKKKKKAKHLGSAYDQGWQMDCAFLNEQKDPSKRRLDNHYFESNGTSFSPHHVAKKPKMLNKSVDSTYDNVSPMTGSIPSPAASQMNNMPNQSRLIKLITGSGRDKGRKPKTLKMSTVQSGAGTSWSLFEDQALVVLVHDMGPNWELISDAINSTLHFKCIFRKPKECKERHKTLMERGSGDGADSADDSGSSQSYPSTLPGIPKGSARQLFQRLQGPMEEDTLKSHFDIIIKMGQKQHLLKNQNGKQDPKQIVPVHSSHVAALYEVCPNNLNGDFLTPLDLCDATTLAPDILAHGYQGTHANGLALPNQGSTLPTSGVNSTIQGSSAAAMGNNLPSPSGQLAASMSRYGVSRVSMPVDEQQRVQQYNQMLSGRNVQQPVLSVPSSLSGSDRSVRMLPGGNGMGMMCGISRSMPVSRPGFQGMASSSMLNSGSMLSTSMVGIVSPVNMHTGTGPGPGNSILRPRDALHAMRPGHNPEHQRQMVPDLQMQVTQGNSPGVPAFNGLSSSYNSQSIPAGAQPFPVHGQHQQSHPSGPHHSHRQGSNNAANTPQQAYAIRLAKERQLQQQQRYLQQQQHQHQFAASNTLMEPVQQQSQLPMSSSLQHSSPIQAQGSSQPVSSLPVTPSSTLTSISSQHQQKHHLPQHGMTRTPVSSGLSNQAVKQRQRQAQQQQFPQPSRQHPNQRQHAQPQQQAKLLKGIGRGNTTSHQSIPVDSSHLNGVSIPPGSQTGEKGDQIVQMMQGQGLYSGSCINSSQSSKTFVPQSSNHSQMQQRVHSPATTASSKQLQQPVPPDSCTQGQAPQVPPGNVLPASSPVLPSAVTSNQQMLQLQPQSQSLPKQDNQDQLSGQRTLQQSRLIQSESLIISQAGASQVEQQPANNANQVSVGSAAPLVSMNVTNTMSNNAAISQRKASELPHETSTTNPTAKVGSVGSPVVLPVQHSAGKEPLPPINHGLGPRQLSGSLPPHGHNTGAQRQQKQQLAFQQSSAHILSQQSFQTSEQQEQQQEQEQHSPKCITLQHQPQQQLQAGQNNLHTGPPNSKVE